MNKGIYTFIIIFFKICFAYFIFRKSKCMNLATQPDIVCPVDFGPITFMLLVKPDQ